MTTLFLDKEDLFVKAEQDAIAIYQDGKKHSTVPINCLDTVVVGGKTTIESSLLGKLGEHHVAVLVLSGRKQQVSLMLPSGAQGVEKRLAQFKALFDEELSLKVAKSIVKDKIISEKVFLQSLSATSKLTEKHLVLEMISELDRHIGSIESMNDAQELLGLEGSSAACYFKAYTGFFPPSLEFRDRNRRPPKDPVNACLSLGYTLLYSVACQVCNEAGFDSMIGFYHKPLSGRHSLACDLVEPQRTIIDRMIYELFHEEILRVEEFSKKAEGCQMSPTAKLHLYEAFRGRKENLRKEIGIKLEIITEMIMGHRHTIQ